MVTRKKPEPSPVEKSWSSRDEINRGIAKLNRRIDELESLDLRDALVNSTGQDDVAISSVRATIGDVFGLTSPEHMEHQHIRMWSGPVVLNMAPIQRLEGKENGRKYVIATLKGLIGRLQEKAEELSDDSTATPATTLQFLNLHPRISEVASDLFEDGHPWEAVFAAAKALVNYVKDRSGLHHLDGAALMRTAFSRNNPHLSFSSLSDQTEQDEQEGMMHLFEGVVLGIRNPGGHAFPEGPAKRAVEYLSLISLLAYRTQEAKKRVGP